ncbi:MAG TPA: hypothetical protein EYP33_03455, partial [Pyrodictium sp.]|nr:hypothetical protein [Pyrodictium sp.]
MPAQTRSPRLLSIIALGFIALLAISSISPLLVAVAAAKDTNTTLTNTATTLDNTTDANLTSVLTAIDNTTTDNTTEPLTSTTEAVNETATTVEAVDNTALTNKTTTVTPENTTQTTQTNETTMADNTTTTVSIIESVTILLENTTTTEATNVTNVTTTSELVDNTAAVENVTETTTATNTTENTTTNTTAMVETTAGTEVTASNETVEVNVTTTVSVSTPGIEFNMTFTHLTNVTPGEARALVLVYSSMIRSALAGLGLLDATPGQIAEALDILFDYAVMIYHAVTAATQLDSLTDDQVVQLLHETVVAHKVLVEQIKKTSEKAVERVRERIEERVMERIVETVEEMAYKLNDTELIQLAQQLRSMTRLGNYSAENVTQVMKQVVARIETSKAFMLAMQVDNATMVQLLQVANATNITDAAQYMARLQESLAKALKLVEKVQEKLREMGVEPEEEDMLQVALDSVASANETIQQAMLAAKIYAAAGLNATNATVEAVQAAFSARIDRLSTRVSALM